jgi:hypothetical protein
MQITTLGYYTAACIIMFLRKAKIGQQWCNMASNSVINLRHLLSLFCFFLFDILGLTAPFSNAINSQEVAKSRTVTFSLLTSEFWGTDCSQKGGTDDTNGHCIASKVG